LEVSINWEKDLDGVVLVKFLQVVYTPSRGVSSLIQETTVNQSPLSTRFVFLLDLDIPTSSNYTK